MTRRWLTALIVTIAVTTLLVAVPAPEAHVQWHIGIGPFWWPYSYGWYPGPYYYPPPSLVVVEPPVYVEMPPSDRYWYYCAPSQAYYPYVETCTEPWIKVPARGR